MSTYPTSRLRTIGEAPLSKPELAVGTFEPRRLEFLGLFEHARELCNTFVVANDMPHGLIAVAVPVPVPGSMNEWHLNIPVLEPHRNVRNKVGSDADASVLLDKARKGNLIADFRTSTVGIALAYFSCEYRSLTPELLERLEADRNRSSDKPWLCLSQPAQRYGDCYLPLARGFEPELNLVRPIRFGEDGPLFGVVGVDCWSSDLASEPTNSDEFRRLTLMLENLERLLGGTYWSYYSHLDPPPSDFRKGMVDSDLSPWRWESRGRVLGRQFLEEFGNQVAQKQHVLGGEHALVFYCDGNGIKTVNDSAGHEVGNEAIRLIGGVLWHTIQELCGESKSCTDGFVVRWGGDEFVALIGLRNEEADASAVAAEFCKSARKNMAAAKADLAKVLASTGRTVSLPEGFGLSMGWSKFTVAGGRSLKDIWGKDAEEAMYCCKAMTRLAADLQKKKHLPKCPSDSLLANVVGDEGRKALSKLLFRELDLE